MSYILWMRFLISGRFYLAGRLYFSCRFIAYGLFIFFVSFYYRTGSSRFILLVSFSNSMSFWNCTVVSKFLNCSRSARCFLYCPHIFCSIVSRVPLHYCCGFPIVVLSFFFVIVDYCFRCRFMVLFVFFTTYLSLYRRDMYTSSILILGWARMKRA